jgi:hypothetical protein
VVDEQHAPWLGCDQLRVRDDADRPLAAIDSHGGAVVDARDERRDVADEVVGAYRGRLGVHERPARHRQRDHATGDVAVPRRRDDRGAALGGEGEHVAGRARPVARHEQCDAKLDRSSLGVVAVADDHHVAVADAVRQRVDVHRQHPYATRQLEAGLALHELAIELRNDRIDGRGGVGETGDLARLADVAGGERSLRHHPGQRAVVVDHRHELEVMAGHGQADLADRLAVAGGREARLHDVAHA